MNNARAFLTSTLQKLCNCVMGAPIWCLFTFSTKVLNICNSYTNVILEVGVHLGVIGLHPLHSPPFVRVFLTPKHIVLASWALTLHT
jgi:hypothetical protein